MLHCIPDDVSGCDDSESEFDNLYTPELDTEYSFSDESEQDISGNFHSSAYLPDRPPKRPRIQNQLVKTKVPQERMILTL